MTTYDVIVVGGGPAGLTASLSASESGARVLLIDRNPVLGGQLIKQTHMFFGSKAHDAGTRGFVIARKLIDEVKKNQTIDVLENTTVTALYDDMVVTTYDNNQYRRFQGLKVIVATGASEKFLAFENNDLPGVYGAGAIQTLMNLYGVRPGSSVVVVGSGNIGLIVSYQMVQAGIHVKMVLEAAKTIGGYKVHAAKLRRLGIPIETQATISRAIGKESLEAIEWVRLDEAYKPIPKSEQVIETDTLAIAVGLSPMSQLTQMAGAKMISLSALGGIVPILDQTYQTTKEGIYACGDASGIEEASAAMMEGHLAGLHAAHALGMTHPEFDRLIDHYEMELSTLREGPFGEKIRDGLNKIKEARHAS